MLTLALSTDVLSRVFRRAALIAVLVIGSAIGFAAGPPTVQIVAPGAPPLQVGGTPRPFQVNVANEAPGDQPAITSFTVNGVACTPAICGSFSDVTGTPGSGSYTMTYTPPSSPASAVSPTVTVSPSLPGQSFAGTLTLNVFAAGIVLQAAVSGAPLSVVQVGSAPRTLTYTTFNDVDNAGLTFTLTGSGYACQDLSSNSCGRLGEPQVAKSGTTTTTTITYTPPASIPDEPYDRVRIQAASVADPTKVNNLNFLLSGGAAQGGIPYGLKFDSALTGGPLVSITANFSDTTASKTVAWTLTANGAPCPSCGTLGTPAVTSNGDVIASTVTYTPPAAVPSGEGQNSPTITAVLTSNPGVKDSFSFNIVDGTCGTGNETFLNGQYAFLLKGGGATVGYAALIGSFTADGSGNIVGGFQDFNRSTNALTGLTVVGSYSVGPDNRGCLTLTNSNGGTLILRIALGTISGGTATQGALTAFVDTTGQNQRLTGVLKQQNLTNLASSTLNGTYAFGEEGVDSSGHRIAVAGLMTADGAGNITNVTADVNDNGNAVTIPGGSGSYILATSAPGGRGTLRNTIPAGAAPVTANLVLYMVSSSDFFFMTTDTTDGNHPILTGEAKLQTGPFSTSMLATGSGYVFWASGIDGSNGGSVTTLGQSQFTTDTGIATVTADTNDYEVDGPEASVKATFSVDSSGRMTIVGLGPNPPVVYLVDSTQGFSVGTGSSVSSGYIQQQTLSSFNTSAISGRFFFAGGAATTGSSFDSGTIIFSPGEPSGTLTPTIDSSQSNCAQNPNNTCQGNGLSPNGSLPGLPYTFSASSAAPGQGCIAAAVAGQSCLDNGGLIAYILSPSQIIFMQTGMVGNINPAEIFVAQQ